MEIKRYAEIAGKFPREIVLLKSSGCGWGKCAFCDYWTDAESDLDRCGAFNQAILGQVKGSLGVLEVINSASFDEFPEQTVRDILKVCAEKGIRIFISEQHFRYRASLPAIRDAFARIGAECAFILSVETFDEDLRERVFRKGLGSLDPADLAREYQWVNLLCGVKGQTLASIIRDITLGMELFERVNVNMFIPNTTHFERDPGLIEAFYTSAFFDALKDKPTVEILDKDDSRTSDHLGFLGYPEHPDA
ncbi:MAG: hypothetical protein LBG90_06640 [Spirochaetaceae bacterium]|jgi:hypothetical protein|nr:hypothetical protein [Spirochaetaceae bacterium]